jgi:UDP-2,3-diacylglucosamine hydrolase
MKALGLIAGNGKFPFLVLDAARAQGYEVVVAAIKEEAFPEIESHGAASVHWLSLGELSRLIETFKQQGVERAVMAGQVKHKQIFSAIRPDWRLAKLLLSLSTRNTDALLGAVAKVLADEGIVLESSTWLLEPLLVKAGVRSKRAPTEQERANIEYGRMVARSMILGKRWSLRKRLAWPWNPWKVPTPRFSGRARLCGRWAERRRR